ncbi:MAG: elongation factor 1-beta [Candidatus Thermoplasmatota archaeon]|jgi:elongation factor 1-beta|nr:elongation factor 1-beta [Candidatus Thermoplasmatota archaeon]
MMGDVVVAFRVLPDDPEAGTDKLQNLIRSKISGMCEINKIFPQEIAFGLKAIRVEIIIPDQEGKVGEMEETLMHIPGVSQVDTEDITLV